MSQSELQFAIHLIRHIVDVIIRVKNVKSSPVIIAPVMLVAANVMPSSTMAVRIVPKIPVNKIPRVVQTHVLVRLFVNESALRSVTARYPTAIPNKTHKKAGVTVITAVIDKSVVTIPATIPARTDNTAHPFI